jgi:hypothetical protein
MDKSFAKKIEENTELLGGIFAAVGAVCILIEMAFAGFSKESIVGGIKDFSGILLDVLIIVIAATQLIKKPVNFKEKFNEAMSGLKAKYNPLLSEDKIGYLLFLPEVES